MANVLPQALQQFFDRTSREVDALYKPDWLVNELEDTIWRVRSGHDLRMVGPDFKGGTALNWDLLMPGGRLVDNEYTCLLGEAKIVIVNAFDGASVTTGSLRSIGSFHRYLLWFIEFLAVRDSQELKKNGLRIATAEDIVEFLQRLEDSGVCGTGAFIDRWEAYLRIRLRPSVGEHEILDALRQDGAYDARGNLRAEYVGNAIALEASRVRHSLVFMNHLARYEACRDRYPVGKVGGRYVANIARWCVILSSTLRATPKFGSFELADVSAITNAVAQFRIRTDRRTRTMPISVGKQLIAGCCTWIVNNRRASEQYIQSVCEVAGASHRSNGDDTFMRSVIDAEKRVLVPVELAEVLAQNILRSTNATSCTPSPSATFLPISFHLHRIHSAVCFVLITLLGCCRRNEVVELNSDSAYIDRGRGFLNVSLRKTGIDITRRVVNKPVPRLICECLTSIATMKAAWSTVVKSKDPLMQERALFRVSARGLSPLEKEDVYTAIDELCDFLDIRDGTGERWYVRPHQLRRYFAMTFFHFSGAENSLPALTWFMGHDDIVATWRYIKESLTGKEITDTEAAMATAAVYSEDKTEAVCKLREIVFRHFGCDHISVMNEREVQAYLELLAEQGVYTATPIQVASGRRVRFTVLISIRRKMANAEA